MILYFLLINLAYFALVVVIYAVGFEYDKAYKLYPEDVQLSYDLSIGGVYGQRWVRFFEVAIYVGVIVDLVLGFMWYRGRPAQSSVLEL